eukprot:CAMPEP_0205802760 /NCGR_PEP_ID=MMETSP0205-20121125/5211_1 /ASSEMBLY_ACC=CAM_ASM_000278 /TAXON_ID=36767 /ORGANISM="Euplotes focardii, Strain TN1" /LENGTH=57 /DNA_ID=CAMNT_0053069755 /DNA_START=472 /DNA_END=642 /DNA_ORIENTATION=+
MLADLEHSNLDDVPDVSDDVPNAGNDAPDSSDGGFKQYEDGKEPGEYKGFMPPSARE